MADQDTIKGTIEEELYDVLYYVVCLPMRTASIWKNVIA